MSTSLATGSTASWTWWGICGGVDELRDIGGENLVEAQEIAGGPATEIVADKERFNGLGSCCGHKRKWECVCATVITWASPLLHEASPISAQMDNLFRLQCDKGALASDHTITPEAILE